MRPTLAALQEQQTVIDTLRRQAKQNQRQYAQQVRRQAAQIERLARGLDALARMAGVSEHVASAMLKRADVQNPAQPVPEPPAQPAPQPGIDVKTPEAFANVSSPGLVPGSTNDVAADATTTAYTPGMDIAAPAFKNLVDVTAPVDGTQGPRPLEETKTLTDVRVGDPMRPEVAFPLRGDFASAQRTSSRNEDGATRTMAALRLARLHIEAGMVDHDDDLAAATAIEKDASRTLSSIEQEITTLEGVRKAAARRKLASNPRLVPRTASMGQRSTPSLQATASMQGPSGALDDSDLFD